MGLNASRRCCGGIGSVQAGPAASLDIADASPTTPSSARGSSTAQDASYADVPWAVAALTTSNGRRPKPSVFPLPARLTSHLDHCQAQIHRHLTSRCRLDLVEPLQSVLRVERGLATNNMRKRLGNSKRLRRKPGKTPQRANTIKAQDRKVVAQAYGVLLQYQLSDDGLAELHQALDKYIVAYPCPETVGAKQAVLKTSHTSSDGQGQLQGLSSAPLVSRLMANSRGMMSASAELAVTQLAAISMASDGSQLPPLPSAILTGADLASTTSSITNTRTPRAKRSARSRFELVDRSIRHRELEAAALATAESALEQLSEQDLTEMTAIIMGALVAPA